MQIVDENYTAIIAAGDYDTETKLVIAGMTFGEDRIYSASISRALFKSFSPTVGGCVSAELDCVIEALSSDVPRMAKIEPYVRVRKVIDGEELVSGWIRKGIFFADSREINLKQGTVTIHAYDAMLAMEMQYTAATALDDDAAVAFIISAVNSSLGAGTVALDPETTLPYSYTIPVPDTPTSMRNVMGNIAAAYAGNWIITDTGKLKLIKLNSLPPESYLLVDRSNQAITFGDASKGAEVICLAIIIEGVSS